MKMEETVLETAALREQQKPAESACQNCGAHGLSVFYEVRDIPVHSNLMLDSMQEALRFPVRDLKLAFCAQCSFITNMIFDPQTQDYSPIYEDQQSFSSTFNAFAAQLAERLVRKHDLYNQDIVEIGCGKGDFLVQVCRLGNNRGVGIDPTCVEERIPADMRERVRFVRDYYSERYAGLTGKMVMCRHTLEHIFPTFKFVSTIRRAIGDERDSIVFFEVPDTRRVLQELAFWDIYYEHCSYFTEQSLENLFYKCGFEILDLSLDFDDQYLLIEAKVTNGRAAARLSASADGVAQEVRYFANHIDEKLRQCSTYLQRLYGEGKRTVIWGSGSKCVAFLTTLNIRDEIGCVVDINPHRHGKFIPGLGIRIQSPDFLKEYRPDVVIIMNPVYQNEIQQTLSNMNLAPRVTTVRDV